jgi:hypothetical protein
MSASAAQRAVELFRSAAPRPTALAPVIPLGRPQPARSAPAGWVEQYQARLRMARMYLEGVGLAVSRHDDGGRIPQWLVTGQKHPLGNDELILLAMQRGMQ